MAVAESVVDVDQPRRDSTRLQNLQTFALNIGCVQKPAVAYISSGLAMVE